MLSKQLSQSSSFLPDFEFRPVLIYLQPLVWVSYLRLSSSLLFKLKFEFIAQVWVWISCSSSSLSFLFKFEFEFTVQVEVWVYCTSLSLNFLLKFEFEFLVQVQVQVSCSSSRSDQCWFTYSHWSMLFIYLPPANEVCEGYVFIGVCLSTRGGGVCPIACWDTANKWAVRILLECKLVYEIFRVETEISSCKYCK